MSKDYVDLEVGSDGVAFITIINPPYNSLTIPVLSSLRQKYLEALQRSDVKAIVLTGAGDHLSNGFNVEGMEETKNEDELESILWMSVDIQSYIMKGVDGIKKPSVAAIKGKTLDGALALSLSCDACIASHSAKLSLRDIQYGPLTAVTGILMFPSLSRISKSAKSILFSKQISSEEARELGLIDSVAPHKVLLQEAHFKALDLAGIPRHFSSKYTSSSSMSQEEIYAKCEEKNGGIFGAGKKRILNNGFSSRNFFIILDAMENTWAHKPLGFRKKKEKISRPISFKIMKSLTHVCFALQATEEVVGVTNMGLIPSSPKRAGVIGGGILAPSIAVILIMNKIPVLYKEENADLLKVGLHQVKEKLQKHFMKGEDLPMKFEKAFSLLKGVSDYKEFKTLDIVFEAAPDNVQYKQQLFSELEKVCNPTCILTTTSTMEIFVVGEKTSSQHRIVGTHFVTSYADEVPILEIAKTYKTEPQVLVDLIEFSKDIQKLPIVVGSCPGYAIHRTFYPYTQSAVFLVDLGMDPYQIDYVVQSFGIPMGPFRRADFFGFEAGLERGARLAKAFPDRMYKSFLIPMLVADKRYGERSRKGFYNYDDTNVVRHDPDIHKYLEASRSKADWIAKRSRILISDEEILEMILFPIVNEGCRTIEELVTKASDLDVASILYLGFPLERGGIMYWADNIGLGYINKKMSSWSKLYGDIFKPCPLLEFCAAKDIKLGSRVQAYKSSL